MHPKHILAIFLWLSVAVASAQEEVKKDSVRLTDIPGYLTLKCDFHMHTVFSDGHVWPSFRVHEAVRDKMDAISLTEHIDYEGFPDEIQRNYNRSYEIASAAAAKSGLLIIRGAEISPRVPPYHNNALFLTDANILPFDYMKSGKKQFVMKDSMTHAQLIAPFLEAKKQGAFVFYNHPGYSWWDKKDTSIFTRFHEELLRMGILKGVEVVNSGRYNIIGHQIAMKYNLAMVCNTDEHYDMYPRYERTHRPMTLVFAKERTVDAIHEALEARRTALFFDNYLVARQPEAESFFKASLQTTTERRTRNGERILVVKMFNKTSIPYTVKASADYDIEGYPLGQLVLKPRDTTELILKTVWKYPEQVTLRMQVSNILVTPEAALQTTFLLPTEQKQN